MTESKGLRKMNTGRGRPFGRRNTVYVIDELTEVWMRHPNVTKNRRGQLWLRIGIDQNNFPEAGEVDSRPIEIVESAKEMNEGLSGELKP